MDGQDAVDSTGTWTTMDAACAANSAVCWYDGSDTDTNGDGTGETADPFAVQVRITDATAARVRFL